MDTQTTTNISDKKDIEAKLGEDEIEENTENIQDIAKMRKRTNTNIFTKIFFFFVKNWFGAQKHA